MMFINVYYCLKRVYLNHYNVDNYTNIMYNLTYPYYRIYF